MRAALLCVGLAACSPSIAPESYECGPEELCPEDQVCNGPDAVCVTAGLDQPFACGASAGDVEPNDAFEAATATLGDANCVTLPAQLAGCVDGADSEDWYQVKVKDGCLQPQIEGRVTFPIAFEPLAVELRAEDGSTVATGTDCAGTSQAFGDHAICVTAQLPASGTYALRVVRTGADNCDGACAYNRYTATLQLTQGN